MTDSSAPPDLDSAIATLWLERRDSVVERVGAIEMAAAAMFESSLPDDVRAAALLEAHKLKGTLGTFGFRRASRLVGSMDEAIRSAASGPTIQVVGRRLVAEVVRLRELLDEGPEPQVQPVPTVGPPIVIVGEADLVTQLADSASRDYDVIQPRTPDEIWAAVTTPGVAAVVIARPGTPASDDVELVGRIGRLPTPVPSIVVAEMASLLERVELSGLGATRILPTGMAPARVVQAVSLLLGKPEEGTARVLVVDDDETVLDLVEVLLQPEGITVERLADPRTFWRRLSECSPDLVVLDEELPHISGLELCRVIRSDAQWCNLPVMFLTARTDPDYVRSVFAVGADDYVAKPIVGPELSARIRNRLERSRLLRQLAETDPLTGVANRRRSEEDIHHLVALAARTGSALSVAAIDLDHFKQVNDIHGHASGDVVLRRLGAFLRQTVRTNDVVGRWGGEEFLLGLFAANRHDAANRLRTLMDSFSTVRFWGEDRAFSVTFSAGVASYPDDGMNLPELYRAADRALYAAKSAGRACVLEAGA